MFTARRREEGKFVFAVSPSRDDFDGDRSQCDALARGGSYDVVVTDEEVVAYRDDMVSLAGSPMLAAMERQEPDVRVAMDVALHKLAARNAYLKEETDVDVDGVYLMETDAEAQAKFKQSLAAGQEKYFDAIRTQQMGERWYERIKEVSGDKPTRTLPGRRGPNGLAYD